MCAGYIGGRMVKWLEEITVTEGESDSFYHFMAKAFNSSSGR